MNRINTSILIKARRTELVDAQEVFRYITKNTIELFGPIKTVGNIHELIEKSVLSITLEDESTQKILAQACFYDYPNVNTIRQSEWEVWSKKHYADNKFSPMNTLFLHFFVAHSEYSISSAQEIIKSAFKAVPECHFIILCVPVNSVPDATLSTVFTELKHSEKPDKCFFFLAQRDKHVPVLSIRGARVNDNDDLVPLFNSYTEVLKATYGDFYVAEMIEAQNAENRCLSSEAQGFAMGFMAITTDVNVDLLNECFELRPFHGLRKPHPDDILNLPQKEPTPLQSAHKNTECKGVYQINEEPVVQKKLSEFSFEDDKAEIEKLEEEALQNEIGEVFDDEKSECYSSKHSTTSHHQHKPKASHVSFVPKYKGTPNAFAIQLFCIEERYESRSLDFLPKAFECFPDKDYCIITVPHTVPEFNLIQSFMRVTPRPNTMLNQELYVFHRAGLIKDVVVRYAQDEDFEAVKKLVDNLSSKEQIINDLQIFLKSRKDENGVSYESFVAVVYGQVVGLCVMKQEEDIEYLRANYNIEDFIYFSHHKREEHGHLKRFILNPVFGHLTKYFIKEILRKSKKTCLYYPIYPEYTNDKVLSEYSLSGAINFMVPIKHRPQISYNMTKLGPNSPSAQALESHFSYPSLFALNHINRKLLLEPKIGVNVRIVVVGASETALSFLETLAFSPHLRFNNLTLVSENGLPGTLNYDLLRDQMTIKSLNYNHDDHAKMSLRSWVNVVCGKLTAIDRKQKKIAINNKNILSYDHLILCTGEQFYRVAPTDAPVFNFYTKKEVEPSIERILFDQPPPNMFIINDEYDAENLLYYIEKHNIIDSNDHIIFYGLDISVYCVIAALIELKVNQKRIVVVYPKHDNPKHDNESFNNPFIEAEIKKEMNNLGIQFFDGYFMKEWNSGDWHPGNKVKNVKFELLKSLQKESTKEVILSFDCGLLFSFYKRDVDYNSFISANQSSLVFDGRLVIDRTFHTNDLCIRAAGTMTKFKRSYYADEWTHKCFNSKDVGFDLAINILKLLDPTAENNVDNGSNEKEDMLIPLYKAPKKIYTKLPGGYHYLNITKPGLLASFLEQTSEENAGMELVTNTSKGYFRIHLNQHKTVETVTCLSRNEFPALNYVKLYGLHERFLNNLVLRYKQGLIKDFYGFFNESWSVALFHDRFSELCKEIREILLNQNNGLKSIEQVLQEQIDDDLILTKKQRDTIQDYFKSSGNNKLVEQQLLKYLNYNYNLLPMYAKPDMV